MIYPKMLCFFLRAFRINICLPLVPAPEKQNIMKPTSHDHDIFMTVICQYLYWHFFHLTFFGGAKGRTHFSPGSAPF